MFSDQPSNRKRNQKTRASSEPDFQHKVHLDSLREQENRLNAQISELEEILASHAKKVECHHQKCEDILPPLDEVPQSRNRVRQPVRRRSQKSQSDSLYFFILLLIAIALGFWLFYTGG